MSSRSFNSSHSKRPRLEDGCGVGLWNDDASVENTQRKRADAMNTVSQQIVGDASVENTQRKRADAMNTVSQQIVGDVSVENNAVTTVGEECSNGLCQSDGSVEKKLDLKGISALDQEYFKCYSGIHIHEEMLADKVRTNTYRWAILKNYECMRGKVVLDVGAGTGILSIFCVQAGAKRVYAIEASDMAGQIRKVVAENGMASRITVIHDKIENVTLPEQVDVIVSEWMGYLLLYESMLSSVIKARDTWLKPDGVILPSSASLHIAPLSDESYDERLDFWSNINKLYKVSMQSMVPYAQSSIASCVCVKTVNIEGIQSHAVRLCRLDLVTTTQQTISDIKENFQFVCFGHARIHGFVTWFTVDFPQNITLSTSPYTLETHWQQTVLYLDKPLDVTQDTRLTGSVHITPNPHRPRFLDLVLSYAIDGQSEVIKTYRMDENIT